MSQFHNVEPRTREERLAQQGGGERLEKARLRAKGIDAPANPLVPVKGSPQYADDNSRFQRDAAALEYERRQAQLARKEASELSHAVLGVASAHGNRRCDVLLLHAWASQVQYEEKRVEHYHREKSRWDHMEQVSKKHEQALDQRRAAVGTFSHRNQSGEHFDIITLQHRPTPGGERLRAAVRLQVVSWRCTASVGAEEVRAH